MLTAEQQRVIEQATVTILGGQGHGRGVLIPGNMILTAAHCITYTTDGAMVLGDYFIEEVRTAQGTTVKARPAFVEPVADIALLSALDDQAFGEEVDTYDTWYEQTTPVGLSSRDLPFDTPVPIQVYTHLGQWISGTVRQMNYEAHALSCSMTIPILGGTSGSPIVTAESLIVGVVSFSNEGTTPEHECWGMTPRPHLTLPVWALRQMDAVVNDEDEDTAARRAWYGIR